ncbi:hypothetical protein [Micromonospora coxensis]|uniref:Uncharacterized protein n=1 Tax=Micromonospora coxensis TaxID=356852 RepID=A0A1C5GYL8_9ACTN|nr:hypothetical protein [Micromonospora coxensis]SCG38902.1 hypothetical protein GA0070614_0575 [Micromonospora coxensis]
MSEAVRARRLVLALEMVLVVVAGLGFALDSDISLHLSDLAENFSAWHPEQGTEM